jgi:hypothetical protein
MSVPRLSARDRAFVREFFAIRREVSAAELRRLPSADDMAHAMNCSKSVFYRAAAGHEPRRSHPRDRVDVSREPKPSAEQSA